MKPLQALLTWVTYEVSVGLMVRDLEPLAMAPLDEKLQEVGLLPASAFAALRESIRSSLRVLRVALHGGLQGVEPARVSAFNEAMNAVVRKERAMASQDCQVAIKHAGDLFDLSEFDEDLLYQTIAYSDAILSPRAMEMQAGFGSSYLAESLRAKLGDGAPLLRALEDRDLLREGILYFFVQQVRSAPDVDEMLTEIAQLDGDGLVARIERRRDKLRSRLELETSSGLKRQVLSERVDLLENLALTLSTQLEIAHTHVRTRAAYGELMAPVLERLDELYVAVEQGAHGALDDTTGLDGASAALGDDVVERYTAPLEGGDSGPAPSAGETIPNDPEGVFKLATSEFMQGRYNKAIRLYNRAIDLDPTMSAAHFNLSQAYLRRGRWSNALASYQQAVFLDPRCRLVPPEFEVEEILGAGGMGILFRGLDTRKDRLLTIRMIKPSLATDERMSRLVGAIKLLRGVESPVLVKVRDLRKFKQHLLLFCDYARGTSLRQIVEAEALSPRGAITLMRQVAECVHLAHMEGAVHNNLKPSCIFVDDKDKVKVGEFALMALIGNDPGEIAAAGLPTEYLAPEQLEQPEPSFAADAYALGMIFYEMIHGQRWKPGLTFREGPGSPIDGRLATLMNKAVHPQPSERCSVGEMFGLLRELAPGDTTRALTFDLVMAVDDDEDEDEDEDD